MFWINLAPVILSLGAGGLSWYKAELVLEEVEKLKKDEGFEDMEKKFVD
jgi:hypothetical protein